MAFHVAVECCCFVHDTMVFCSARMTPFSRQKCPAPSICLCVRLPEESLASFSAHCCSFLLDVKVSVDPNRMRVGYCRDNTPEPESAAEPDVKGMPGDKRAFENGRSTGEINR